MNYTKTMFAIAYDFDTEKLKANYHNASYNNAYADVRNFLKEYGFSWQQGSVLYGDEKVTSTIAHVAIAKLSQKFPWVKPSLVDIRILQLLANDDLMPVVDLGASLK